MQSTMARSINQNGGNHSPTYETDSKDLHDRMLAAEVLADFASMTQKSPMGISKKGAANSPQYHMIHNTCSFGAGNKNDTYTCSNIVPSQNLSRNAISLDHSGMAKSLKEEPIKVKKRFKTSTKQQKRVQRRNITTESDRNLNSSSNEFVDVIESSTNRVAKDMKNERNKNIALSEISKGADSPIIIKAEYFSVSSPSHPTISIPSDVSIHSRLCVANTIVTTKAQNVQKDCALPLKKRKFVASMELMAKIANLPISPSSSTTSPSPNTISDEKSMELGTSGIASRNADTHSIYNSVIPAVRTPQPEESSSMVPGVDSTSEVTSSDAQQGDVKGQSIIMEDGSALSYHVDPQKSLQMLKEIHLAQRQDEDGDLPLHIAVIHENLAMVKRLVHLLQIAEKSVDKYNRAQQTPLHLAIKVNFTDAVTVLLTAKADVNLVDRLGHNAVHLCVKHQLPKCLAYVLKHSKHPDLNKRDFEGLTPLHTAVTLKNADILQSLLDSGADPDVVDGKSGRTPLFHAAESESSHMLELLIQGHANVEVANYAGITAIVAANARGSSTTVKQLLRNGADPAGMILVEDNFTEMQMKKVQVQKFPTVKRSEIVPGRRFLTQKIKSAVNAFVQDKAAKQQQDVVAEN